MSTGLLALLDDVALIARIAAASLDDVAAASMKATSKSLGVVIDDAAVTPKYVVGFSAKRELPIVKKIAVGSLKNKLLFILPAALILGYFANWMIHPLLLLGGLFLSYEGAEKIISMFFHHEELAMQKSEAETVKGAIRTDFILSAEIMALALASVQDMTLTVQASVLFVVAFVITFLVYGVVAIIVKADDFGVHLIQENRFVWLGNGIVKAMPVFLVALTVIGTIAMLWVGGSIIFHSIEHFGFRILADYFYSIKHELHLESFLKWVFETVFFAIIAFLIGSLVVILKGVMWQQKNTCKCFF